MTKTNNGWAVETGEIVTVRPSAYVADGFSGRGEILDVSRDRTDLLVALSGGREVWVSASRIEGCDFGDLFVLVD